ncbi:MAG TPA: hypothetical protein DDZ80_05075 [Cyanobacteria bacterium UBA8803]|nr:hypothetical protein [Cyanobacteria bacterium UBA9273]HBL57919.1 hypothetical protein [Cyanobacteria bacterium UBA8803]
MKQQFDCVQGLLSFVTPLLTGLAFATSPTLAATLASSEAQVNIDNFSHNPLAIEVLTKTKTEAIASSGQVDVTADADANFIVDPFPPLTRADNTSVSQAHGAGSSYFGFAQSIAGLIGYNFLVQGGQAFSFDFNTFLGLETSLDRAPGESSTAFGEISLLLYDSTDENNWQLLDFFGLAGSLTTLGDNDFLNLEHTPNITLTKNQLSTDFEGTKEFAEASIKASYSRNFDTLTYLTLIEAKLNRVTVQTPESSNLVGLFVFGLLCIGHRLKKQHEG